MAAYIYVETSIWNELCNQETNPGRLSSRLASQGATLVLGMNVFYEMVKTFGMRQPRAATRASQLFTYLKGWMRGDFPIVRQTPEILVDEVLYSLGVPRRTPSFCSSMK